MSSHPSDRPSARRALTLAAAAMILVAGAAPALARESEPPKPSKQSEGERSKAEKRARALAKAEAKRKANEKCSADRSTLLKKLGVQSAKGLRRAVEQFETQLDMMDLDGASAEQMQAAADAAHAQIADLEAAALAGVAASRDEALAMLTASGARAECLDRVNRAAECASRLVGKAADQADGRIDRALAEALEPNADDPPGNDDSPPTPTPPTGGDTPAPPKDGEPKTPPAPEPPPAEPQARRL